MTNFNTLNKLLKLKNLLKLNKFLAANNLKLYFDHKPYFNHKLSFNTKQCSRNLYSAICILLAFGCLLFGAGCTHLSQNGTSSNDSTRLSQFVIDDKSYQAQGKSQRIKSIILHYTAEDEAESIRLLTEENVSAHYLIPLSENNTIYQLVAENERAWHAGEGGFAGRQILNDTSIGIEIVNQGIEKQYRKIPNPENNGYHPSNHFVAFTDIQVRKLAALIQMLTQKYDIEATHIIGHADMAPSRKIDPGAKFPWERLYKEFGIGAWYDEFDKVYFMTNTSMQSLSIPEIKQLFRDYGYQMNDTPTWDKSSQDVVYAFQLHFRQDKVNGIMDVETYAILRALHKKYVEEN